MKTMKEIVENIKDIISLDLEGRVQDQDVANALGCSRGALATAKSRGVVMFEEVSNLCSKKNISINTILFDQAVESLVKSTNRYEMKHYGLVS